MIKCDDIRITGRRDSIVLFCCKIVPCRPYRGQTGEIYGLNGPAVRKDDH